MLITKLKSLRHVLAHSSVSEGATTVSLSILLFMTVLTVPSSATTLLYKSFNDLMKEAEGVVSGHVVSVSSQYNASKEIYTFVTLDQVEVLSGSYRDSTLTISLKGGKIENDTSHVVGSPEFQEGERVVLFINGNGKYMVPLVGWTQGIFRIDRDPATSLDVVKDADGNRVLGVQSGEVIRDQVVQPEATILRQNAGAVGVQSHYEGNAGASDSKQTGSPIATPQAQINVAKSAPTLSAAAFSDLVRKSAVLSQSKAALSSVRVMDFSVPNANSDASMEAKPSPAAAATQFGSPVLPQHNELAPVRDR